MTNTLKKMVNWLVPIFTKEDEDIDAVISVYDGKKKEKTTPEFREYVRKEVKKYKPSLVASKLAELDKFGALIPAEEFVEIPAKMAVYLVQLVDNLRNRVIKKEDGMLKRILKTGTYLMGPENLWKMTRYSTREAISAVPLAGDTVGELADLGNNYLKNTYEDIAKGITRRGFEEFLTERNIPKKTIEKKVE